MSPGMDGSYLGGCVFHDNIGITMVCDPLSFLLAQQSGGNKTLSGYSPLRRFMPGQAQPFQLLSLQTMTEDTGVSSEAHDYGKPNDQ